VPDRPGHDIRYAIDSSKLATLGWKPATTFEAGLDATVGWYVNHEDWWRRLKERSDYVEYFQRNYGDRQPSTPGSGKGD
jgi:dTDP-glucose 4,6-dehydratase